MKNLVIAVGITAIIILGYLGYLHFTKEDDTILPQPIPELPADPNEEPPVRPADPETNTTEADSVTDSPEKEAPTDLNESDDFIKEVVQERFVKEEGSQEEPLSLMAEILERRDLVRKAVTAADLIQRGKNPNSQLFFLQPKSKMEVEEKDGRLIISQKNYHRYQPIMKMIDKIDVAFMADTYRLLRPLCRQAYDELGNENRGWDQTSMEVIDFLIALEVPKGDVAVSGNSGVYIFEDPALEKASPIKKAFIRIGPKNTAFIQKKLKEFKNQINP